MEEETLTTEATPRFVLPPRPTPPDEGTETHELWCRDQSVAYPGGTITTAYGNLVQVWAAGEIPPATVPTAINRKQYTAKRRLNYNDAAVDVNVPAKTYNKYPRHNSSLAAAGTVFTFATDDGDFTARVTGDIQDLIQWISENRMTQYVNFTVYSNRGASYGPFTKLNLS